MDWKQSTRFRLQVARRWFPLCAVKREKLRVFLMVALLCSAAFAAWTWFRPYAWKADPAAGSRIETAQVRSDSGFFWLDLHLKVNEGSSHDLMKPVRLVTGAGRKLEPADTTLGGGPEKGTTDLWFKFWLEPSDFGGPMKLQINDGHLDVRSGTGVPSLGASKREVFPTQNW